eukprot:6898395-Pyramimonas_sp.AAC.1
MVPRKFHGIRQAIQAQVVEDDVSGSSRARLISDAPFVDRCLPRWPPRPLIWTQGNPETVSYTHLTLPTILLV